MPRGPGAIMQAALARLGAAVDPACNCEDRIETMDAWGPAGCWLNFTTIVGWLYEAAEGKVPRAVCEAITVEVINEAQQERDQACES